MRFKRVGRIDGEVNDRRKKNTRQSGYFRKSENAAASRASYVTITAQTIYKYIVSTLNPFTEVKKSLEAIQPSKLFETIG